MTNAESILGEMILNNLDPTEVVVRTCADWNRKGFKIKKGEHPVFKTKIWKPSKYSKKEIEDEENNVTEQSRKLILVKADFYTDKQVERRVENA